LSTEQKLPVVSGAVLWLIPSEAETAVFQNEINRLADRFKTVPFSPHLTLGRLPADRIFQDSFISPNEKSDALTNKIPAAGFDCLKCTESPYQNLIASLEQSTELVQIQEQIASSVPGYSPKEEYHISLLYGHVPCRRLQDEKNRLLENLPKQIHFSRLCMVHLNGGPESWSVMWERNM